MRIADVGDLPDLSRYRTIVVTSSNAVIRLAETGALRGRLVATVGEVTAGLARAAGAEAITLGQDVTSFLTRAGELEGPCLHCRGVHARGDIAERLNDLGIRTDEAVIYDQIAQPLSVAARGLLGGSTPIVAPLFSPRAAALFTRVLPAAAPLTIIAMSSAVADACSSGKQVVVAKEPTVSAMCDATISVI